MDEPTLRTSRCPRCGKETTPGGDFCPFCGAPLRAAEADTQPLASPPAVAAPPAVFGGRFEVVRELGRGGFGIVYEARDRMLDRTVAIKTIRKDGFSSRSEAEGFERRLLREARAVAGLAHPNIVALYDAGDHEGSPYLAMEYVPGATLRSVLASRRRLPLDEAMVVATGVLAALQHAHRNGILHRDVKPENVMVREDGLVKVADFGVAKALHVDTPTTKAGSVLGTPSYMAPEQIQGKRLDGRADVFSAAALLYEVLTGQRPFQADSIPSLIYKILHEEPVPPARLLPSLPPAVDAAIVSGLAKSPEARPPTCDAFATLLRSDASAATTARAARETPLAADLPTVAVGGAQGDDLPTGPIPRGAPGRGGVVAAGVLLVAMVGVGVLSYGTRPPVLPVKPPPTSTPLPPRDDDRYAALEARIAELSEKGSATERELEELRRLREAALPTKGAPRIPGDATGSNDAEAIASLMEEADAAFTARDASRLMRLFTEEPRVQLLSGSFADRSQVGDFFQELLRGDRPAGVAFFRTEPCCTYSDGLSATLVAVPRVGPSIDEAELTIVKHGSRWKIASLVEKQPEATRDGMRVYETLRAWKARMSEGNGVAVAQLFSVDGELHDGGKVFRGHDAIRDYYDSSRIAEPTFLTLRHITLDRQGVFRVCASLSLPPKEEPAAYRFTLEEIGSVMTIRSVTKDGCR